MVNYWHGLIAIFGIPKVWQDATMLLLYQGHLLLKHCNSPNVRCEPCTTQVMNKDFAPNYLQGKFFFSKQK